MEKYVHYNIHISPIEGTSRFLFVQHSNSKQLSDLIEWSIQKKNTWFGFCYFRA